MKKISCIVSLLFVLGVPDVNAQLSCCVRSTIQSQEALADDPTFIAAHLVPEPFPFVPSAGKMISFGAPDGKEAKAYVVIADEKSKNFIFMFHEWWGLNGYIKQEAEKLSNDLGANVIAIDLYDGRVTDKREDAAKFSGEIVEERARAIISGAIDYVGKESKIQTIGWCFGGSWSLQASLMAGPNAKGCVMYYGMPELDEAKLRTLNCTVFGVFATKDQWITPEVTKQFKTVMTKVKKQLILKTYDAEHAFANPSNPKHDVAAAKDAYVKVISYLKSNWK